MTEANQSLVDAEKEMTLAIEKINEGITNIDEFKSATESLSDMAEKNEGVLKSLLEVAQLLEAGSKLLNEKGIAQFDNTINERFATTQTQFEKIAELQNDLVQSGNDVTQRVKRLQTVVIALGATAFLAVAAIFFVLM